MAARLVYRIGRLERGGHRRAVGMGCPECGWPPWPRPPRYTVDFEEERPSGTSSATTTAAGSVARVEGGGCDPCPACGRARVYRICFDREG